MSTLRRELGVTPSPETQDLYAVLVERADPPGSLAVAPLPLVGREAPWGRLVQCWLTARGGRSGLAVVRGDAGIGKSRLVEELRAWCAGTGAATAAGRAYEAEGGLAYGPIVDLLRSDDVRGGLRALGEPWSSELGRLVPDLTGASSGAPDDLGPAGDRTLLFEALSRAVTSVPRPLLLVVDDLHWCDRHTLEFLHFLIRAAPSAPLLVVGTYRDAEVDRDHPLEAVFAGLRALGSLTDVALDPLDDEAAAALARRVVPGSDDALVARLVEAAGGNPLFLVELARSGLAQAPAGDGAAARGRATVPPRAAAVIRSRLARLSEPARRVVGAAAVIGRAFSVELIGSVLGDQAEDRLVAALDELWRRRLLRERDGDAYDFDHDLIRQVAYLDLGPATRRRLHREVAAALEAVHAEHLDAVASQIAAHHDRSAQPDRAVVFYQLAIDQAAGGTPPTTSSPWSAGPGSCWRASSRVLGATSARRSCWRRCRRPCTPGAPATPRCSNGWPSCDGVGACVPPRPPSGCRPATPSGSATSRRSSGSVPRSWTRPVGPATRSWSPRPTT